MICSDVCHSLSYLTAWFHFAQCGSDGKTAIKVDSTQNHTLTLNAHHLTRREIGYEEYILANQLIRFIVGSNTAQDSTVSTATVIDGELQQFLALLHHLAVSEMTDTDIQFLESLKGNGTFDWLR